MPSDSPVERHPVASFLAVTYGFTWTAWYLGYLVRSTRVALFVAIVVGGFGPAVGAIAVTRATGGSVREWLRSVLRWRLPVRWYLAAVGVPAVVYAVAAALLVFAGAGVRLSTAGRGALVFLAGLPVATLLTGGNEEFGWRGFLLARLQRRYDAFSASILVGLAWAGWHLPVYFLPLGLIEGSYALFVPFIVAVSVLLTWLYNETGGSVLLAMLMHGSVNSATGLFVGVLVLDGVSETALWGSRIVGAAALAAVLLARYDRTTLCSSPRVGERGSVD